MCNGSGAAGVIGTSGGFTSGFTAPNGVTYDKNGDWKKDYAGNKPSTVRNTYNHAPYSSKAVDNRDESYQKNPEAYVKDIKSSTERTAGTKESILLGHSNTGLREISGTARTLQAQQDRSQAGARVQDKGYKSIADTADKIIGSRK